ncbi:MAG: 16S rRNA (guanine(1207)-N(2))-methyltransferase RsmC, partial [Plesiomonas sp.]
MLCAASEVLQRHEDEFATRHVLFAGDLQDEYCLHMPAASRRVHTAHYARLLSLRPRLGDAITYGIAADADWLAGTDTLIYYWPKTKQEALMQLSQLCSVLPIGCDIFIVGENRVGVRSAESQLSTYGNVHKIDSARRCGLYHLQLTAQTPFALDDWWYSYALNNLTIRALTGVFSSGELDTGTRLLLSTFSKPHHGRALDVGCGAGVIGAHLAQQSPDLHVTMSDINAMAVESARVT